MGVVPKGIKVQELQHRWASCTKAGMLNFHWKIMMAPLTILDYIVVHELAHIIYANHTEAFWNEVDKILPDYLDRKQWLRVGEQQTSCCVQDTGVEDEVARLRRLVGWLGFLVAF